METPDPKTVVTGYPVTERSYPASNSALTSYAYPPLSYYPPPPPPQQPQYIPYNDNYDSSSSIRRFLRFIIIAVIAFFVVSGFITLITWLVLRPQTPVFSVSSASVSSFDISSSNLLSSNFNVNISVSNPNRKMDVSYNKIEAFVLYGVDTISSTSLQPFRQRKGNVTVVPVRFAAVAEYVGGNVANGILKEKGSGGGVVRFRVRVGAWVTFNSGRWGIRRRIMRVYCDIVRIGFSNATASDGSLVGGPTRCQVSL